MVTLQLLCNKEQTYFIILEQAYRNSFKSIKKYIKSSFNDIDKIISRYISPEKSNTLYECLFSYQMMWYEFDDLFKMLEILVC